MKALRLGAAVFSGGAVTFGDDVQFSGGTIDFSTAGGVARSGLVPWNGQRLPTGLSLPQGWYPPVP
jgi:hypothetical protein